MPTSKKPNPAARSKTKDPDPPSSEAPPSNFERGAADRDIELTNKDAFEENDRAETEETEDD